MAREARKTHVFVGDIDVEVERKRVRNLNLRVRRDGSVHASVPWGVPLAEVERFVRSREAWIEGHRTRLEARPRRVPERWEDGETLLLWGQLVTVALTQAAGPRSESVRLEGETLTLSVAERWLGGDEEAVAHRGRLAWRWLGERMREAAEPLIARHEAPMGVHATALRLRRMTSRWGSCNVRTGAVTLNLELVAYPPACLEQVVVHELCHLLEPSHNARFHALMDEHYPTWREARALLRA